VKGFNMRKPDFQLSLLLSLVSIVTATAARADDPAATSTDRPQSNTAIQDLDRKAHPAEIHAVGATTVRPVPGTGSGNMDSAGGSSMGLGISIPLGKPPQAIPKEKPKDASEDADE
jgi:hypothetical protein